MNHLRIISRQTDRQTDIDRVLSFCDIVLDCWQEYIPDG